MDHFRRDRLVLTLIWSGSGLLQGLVILSMVRKYLSWCGITKKFTLFNNLFIHLAKTTTGPSWTTRIKFYYLFIMSAETRRIVAPSHENSGSQKK